MTDREPTNEAILQLKTLRKKLNELADKMLISKAIGSISDVLEVLSVESNCTRPLQLIRTELLNVWESIGERTPTFLPSNVNVEAV